MIPRSLLVSVVVLTFSGLCLGYRDGFTRDKCDGMHPFDRDPGFETHEASSEKNDTINSEPQSDLEISGDESPFTIEAPASKYRRGRSMEFKVFGPEFNSVMLEVRHHAMMQENKALRLGEFKSWPKFLKPVQCDEGRNTALTNADYKLKGNFTVTWQAPWEDLGEIEVVGTYIMEEEFWLQAEGPVLGCHEFPVSLSACGNKKSCFLYSQKMDSCHADNCDYILTYRLLDNEKSVEFVIGGTAKNDDTYLAVGFTSDIKANNMSMISCSRSSDGKEVRYFVVKDSELIEHTMPFEDSTFDIDGDRLWCRFVLPVKIPGEDGLDFTIPLYQVYLWGMTDKDSESKKPVLPSMDDLLLSEKEVTIGEFLVLHHMPSRSDAVQFSSLVSLLISSIFICMWL